MLERPRICEGAREFLVEAGPVVSRYTRNCSFYNKYHAYLFGFVVNRLTTAATDVGNPLDTHPVPYFDTRMLCSWTQFDNVANSFVAANLTTLSASYQKVRGVGLQC